MNVKAFVRKSVYKPLLWRATPIRLAWAGGEDEEGNFGDQLGPLLISRIFGVRVKHSGVSAADMVALGSMMEGVEELVTGLHPYIWGTGFIQPGPDYSGRALRIRAVRGRMTLERLGSLAPENTALGDPGLLANIAFPEFQSLPKRFKVGLIPHYVDQGDVRVRQFSALSGVRLINVLRPVPEVLRNISECDLILSSSLHGLIVSESYGIPNYWIQLGDDVIGGRYKFDDYYSTFGRRARSVDVQRAVASAEELTRSWQPLPNVPQVQRDLIQAFPGYRTFGSGVDVRNIGG